MSTEPSAPDFPHQERAIAATLGVNLAVLKACRKLLRRGIDWELEKNSVSYSEAGRLALLKQLGVPEGAKDAPAQGEPGPHEAVCVRTFALNRQILEARLEDATIRVRVKTNEHFVPGMRLPVRPVNGALYELTRRCPRWKGRW